MATGDSNLILENGMSGKQKTTSAGPIVTEWRRYRPLLTSLYLAQRWTLEHIMVHMRDKFGFKIGLKGYKTRFKEWGLFKNSNRSNKNNRKDQASGGTCKLASLFQETQRLLHKASASNLCVPGCTALNWHCSTSQPQIKAEHFKLTLWQYMKYYSEREDKLAALCQHDALMMLEDFYCEPNLDIWTTFIKCCADLERHGAFSVLESLLQRLQELWQSLALDSQPLHSEFISVLLALNSEELVGGSLAFLEVKLEAIRKVWPDSKQAHFLYRLDVAEARLFAGYTKRKADMPTIAEADAIPISHEWQTSHVQACRVSTCILRGDFTRAAEVAEQCVDRLLKRHHDSNVEVELATFHAVLASLQKRQKLFTAAQENLAQALEAQKRHVNYSRELPPLSFAEVYRIVHLLELLSTFQASPGADSTLQWKISKELVESEWLTYLQWKELPPSKRPKHEGNDSLPSSNGTRKPKLKAKPAQVGPTSHSGLSFKPSVSRYVRGRSTPPRKIVDQSSLHTSNKQDCLSRSKGSGNGGGGGMGDDLPCPTRSSQPPPLPITPFR